jgi:hypothetical protein
VVPNHSADRSLRAGALMVVIKVILYFDQCQSFP